MKPSGAAVAARDGGEEEDRKPVTKGVHLTIKVQNMKGCELWCTMRRTEMLQGLMDAFYASVRLEHGATGRFMYNGWRLAGWQTPAELEMDDGDEIDFFREHLGGGPPAAATPVPA